MSVVGTIMAVVIVGGFLNYRDTYANDGRHDVAIEDNKTDIEKHEERIDAMEIVQINMANSLGNIEDNMEEQTKAVEKILEKLDE